MWIEADLCSYWQKETAPLKYVLEQVDRVRYTTIQLCLENGWHLIVEEPPRSGKTEAVAMFSIAWWLASHPNFKFGLITHSQALGNKFVAGVAKLLEKAGFEFEYARASELKLKGSRGVDPNFWASGIGGGHTGKGCHRLIVSDVLRSGTDAMSDKVRESIVTDIISTSMNRLESYTADDGSVIPGAVTFEQARLHEGDPVGWMLKSGLPVVQHRFPAINDDGASAWVRNGYTGQVFVAKAYSALTRRQGRPLLDAIKAYSTSYFWNCQYLMVCGLGDLVYFKLDRCPRYEKIFQADCWWAACDFANTATATGSRTALCALGFQASSKKLGLLGAEAGRWGVDEMGERMVAFAGSMTRLTGMPPEAICVERAAAGYGIIDRYSGSMPIVPVYPKGSKEERAGSVCWIVNNGNLVLPAEGSFPWQKEWENEVGGFPLQTLNDQPDALTHALAYPARPSEFKLLPQQVIQEYDSMQEEYGGGKTLSPLLDEIDEQCDKVREYLDNRPIGRAF
jgi:predicted phage terminase large subunit-like protein